MFNFLKDKDRTPPALPEGTVRRRYVVSGRVQGVGFRYRAQYTASHLGLTGWVANLWDGSVEMEAQGDPGQLERLVPMIEQTCRWGRIEGMTVRNLPPEEHEYGFEERSGD